MAASALKPEVIFLRVRPGQPLPLVDRPCSFNTQYQLGEIFIRSLVLVPAEVDLAVCMLRTRAGVTDELPHTPHPRWLVQESLEFEWQVRAFLCGCHVFSRYHPDSLILKRLAVGVLELRESAFSPALLHALCQG